jgi:hypothetical protein
MMKGSEDKFTKSTNIKVSRPPKNRRPSLSSPALTLDDEKLLNARTNTQIFPSPSSLAKRNLDLKLSGF